MNGGSTSAAAALEEWADAAPRGDRAADLEGGNGRGVARGGSFFLDDVTSDAEMGPPDEEAPRELRTALPRPVLHRWEEILRQIASTRLVIVRLGRGIDVVALLAVCGAIVFHLIILAALVLSSFWIVRAVNGGGDAIGEQGGASGGVVVEGAGGLAGDIRATTFDPGVSNTSIAAPAPSLPASAVPIAPASGDPLAMLTPSAAPSLFPAAAMADGPRSKIDHPLTRGQPDSYNQTGGVIDLAASVAARGGGAVSVASVAKPGARGGAALNRGGDGEDSGDDGPVINIMKPGTGKGNGKGSGSGNGIDRGASGADLEHPAVLDLPMPDISMDLALKVHGNRVNFELSVTADGKVSDAKLLESSGSDAVDLMCRAAMMAAKFRPAYKAGRAIASKTEAGYDF